MNEGRNDFQQEELDVNKKNREDYEKLMRESSTNLDGYWDRNNIFVRLILFVLGVIIIVGGGYIILTSFS